MLTAGAQGEAREGRRMDEANGLSRLFAGQLAGFAASLKLPLSLRIGRETGGEARPAWSASTVLGIGD